jgi:hypothetical protein
MKGCRDNLAIIINRLKCQGRAYFRAGKLNREEKQPGMQFASGQAFRLNGKLGKGRAISFLQ